MSEQLHQPEQQAALLPEHLRLVHDLADPLRQEVSVVRFGDQVGSALAMSRNLAEARQEDPSLAEAAVAGVALGAASASRERRMLEEHGGQLTTVLQRSGIDHEGMSFVHHAAREMQRQPNSEVFVADMMRGAEIFAASREDSGMDMSHFKAAVSAMAFGGVQNMSLRARAYDSLAAQTRN